MLVQQFTARELLSHLVSSRIADHIDDRMVIGESEPPIQSYAMRTGHFHTKWQQFGSDRDPKLAERVRAR